MAECVVHHPLIVAGRGGQQQIVGLIKSGREVVGDVGAEEDVLLLVDCVIDTSDVLVLTVNSGKRYLDQSAYGICLGQGKQFDQSEGLRAETARR